MSQQEINELNLKYIQLHEKIKKYFIAQSEYFKSPPSEKTRRLIILKNYEKSIKEMIEPKKPKQEVINWLAQ